jgi:hypothetical protein
MAVSARAIPLDIPNESRVDRSMLRRAWCAVAGRVRKAESRLPDPEHLAPDAAWDSPKSIAFVVGGFGMA